MAAHVTTTNVEQEAPSALEQATPPATSLLGSNVYALKEIDMELVEPQFLDKMRNEINLLKIIDHPNILKAFEVYDTQKKSNQVSNNKTGASSTKPQQLPPEGPGISIVMEYCSGGDLHTRSPCSLEHQAKAIVAKLVGAVNYLHLLGIIVRIVINSCFLVGRTTIHPFFCVLPEHFLFLDMTALRH